MRKQKEGLINLLNKEAKFGDDSFSTFSDADTDRRVLLVLMLYILFSVTRAFLSSPCIWVFVSTPPAIMKFEQTALRYVFKKMALRV